MTSLSEELLLLALDDEKGSVGMNASAVLDTALAGTQLLELVLQHKLSISDGRIVVMNASPTGDTVLDHSLKIITDDPKTRKPASWIPKLTKGLRKRLLEQLVGAGIVGKDEKKVLGFISVKRHPTRDSTVENEVRERLRAAVLDDDPVDERTAAIAAVLQASDLEGLVLNRDERRVAKERFKALAAGQAMTPAISSAIASVNAATTAAIVAATSASCSAAVSSGSSC